MKKTYTKICTWIVLLSMFSLKVGAQLSGLYTINQSAPASATNYTSMTAFANDLNTMGVSGAVTADVVPNTGPYNEQPAFNVIVGTSATNSIVIDGNNNVLSFNSTSSAAPWTLLLGGADYMTFNNLTISALGTSYGLALHLWNQSTYNNFNNCTVTTILNSTSTNIMPVTSSASNNSYSSSGLAGQNNYNTWTGCTIIGGYYAVCIYGYTGSPYTRGNNFINTTIKDFYYMGMYNYYHYGFNVTGCTIERPTVGTVTSFYGIYMSGTTVPSTGAINIDGNKIRHPFGANPANTNVCYCIYPAMSGANATDCINIKNNLLSDLNSNGQLMGIYCTSYSYVNVLHNTISYDDQNSTYTGTAYGIYYYGTGGIVKNNLISLTRSGSGTKYGIYYASTVGAGPAFSNGNCVYAPLANSYYGYHWQFGTMSSWQTWSATIGMDTQGGSANPSFINSATGIFIPTNPQIDNVAQPVGVLTDIVLATRGTAPDPGCWEFLNVPCSGSPASAAVTGPSTAICPNSTVTLAASTVYTNSGLSYQWQSSTVSAVGPFSAIPGATLQSFTTPTLNSSVYYQMVITCTNSSAQTAATATQVNIASNIISTVPYNEGFEGISRNNTLPNCSWAASNMSTTCLTYTAANLTYRLPRTGNKFASFYYNPGGTMYFWTNGIQLNSGITYSAAVWYLTEMLQGYNNWSDFSIIINTNQTATGATTIASTGNAAIALAYKLLSNTFTVGTTGVYYIGIKGTGNTSSSAQYLSWDDLSITIPCGPTLNPISLAINPTFTSVCAGQPVSLNASGADTYTWNIGATGSILTNSPSVTTTYSVTGTSTLTGCTNGAAQTIVVKPSPVVSASATFPAAICAGKSINILASGATSYIWNNGSTGPLITVSPSVNTTYTVIGTTAGCNGTAVQAITVYSLPVVSVSALNGGAICLGEYTTLTGSGAAGLSYVWTSNTGLTIPTAVALVNPQVTTNYTLTGTNANGCQGTANLVVSVDACTGLNNATANENKIQVYPNPTSGQVTVEFNNTLNKTYTLSDISGRVISGGNTSEGSVALDLSTLANGIYFVKVETNQSVKVVKIVKQ
ncbi:MAG: T9SS type A sorting domain-containing protein [Bacteroidia bacterium]|nr:T9SS type A sorting domain-containing protein [Bacteroidia bacterium]